MSPREKANILLVDDQPGKLVSLETILASLDENIIKTSSADEALKQLLERDIAVVLVDVCMPNMDGFELAELIRTHPRFERTAIIFISAVHLSDDDRLRGYGLGAVDYIPVPIIPAVLRAKVAVFAELYRKTDQLERLNAELRDRVAELNLSNERLRFADRMATIGTLAAGLGHDMGNLLLPIRMRVDSLAALDLPGSAREDLAAITKAAEYLQRLSGSLRLLTLDSLNEELDDAATDLVDWWGESEGIIRTGVPRGVSFASEIPPDLPPVRIGRAGLTQLVFNLVQNAGDAVKSTPGAKIAFSASTAGRSVRLRVSDNGPGMSEVAKRRCLEPFFTTKTRELSTGLGLTLVAGLVQRAQGSISIESELGRGATFSVELPTTAPVPAVESTSLVRRLVATVTLADPRVLAHVRSVLASLEFDVRVGDPRDTDVWVTEASDHASLDAVMRFSKAEPDCRTVVFGAKADSPQSNDRVKFLEPEFRPSLLRTQLQNALAINEQSPPTE